MGGEGVWFVLGLMRFLRVREVGLGLGLGGFRLLGFEVERRGCFECCGRFWSGLFLRSPRRVLWGFALSFRIQFLIIQFC